LSRALIFQLAEGVFDLLRRAAGVVGKLKLSLP
jgi:hypothetical protein